MKLTGLALLASLASACATAYPMGPDVTDDGDALPGAELGEANTAAPEAPLPGHALCSATVQPLAVSDGTCAVRVDVRIECDPAHQVHTWARIGVLVDGARTGEADFVYHCETTISRLFAVPCGDHAIVGGVSFDHPETAADVHCLSTP